MVLLLLEIMSSVRDMVSRVVLVRYRSWMTKGEYVQFSEEAKDSMVGALVLSNGKTCLEISWRWCS